MKKLLVMLLSTLMIVSLVGCAKTETTEPEKTETETENTTEAETSEDVQIPNPFVDFDSLEEAAAFAGVTAEIPEAGEGESLLYRASENSLLEVVYSDANGNEVMRVRKAAGSDDISGDFNEYTEKSVQLENGAEATERTMKDGAVSGIIWTLDGFSFSVSFEGGVTEEAALAAANALK